MVPKNSNSVIIYSPFCHFKHVWLTLWQVLEIWLNCKFGYALDCCTTLLSLHSKISPELTKPRRFTYLKCLWNCKSEWITTPQTVMAPNAETSGHPDRKPPTPPPHCIPSLHLPSLSNKVTWPDPYLGSERGSPIYPHPSSLPHGCCCSREGWER